MAISGAVVVNCNCAVLLLALPSCIAPVMPVMLTGPDAVGVPDTAHDTVCPTGTACPALHVAEEGLIVHAPTVTPDGKPVTPQLVPAVASAVPPLVQLKLPL